MSRYSLQPLPERGAIYEIAIGWDRTLRTFFVIVFGTPDDDERSDCETGELVPMLWEGTSPAALEMPDAAIALASPYAVIPDGLAEQLEADRLAETTTINSPVQSAVLAALWPKPKSQL